MSLHRLSRVTSLRRGVLVAGFRGWNDAGEAASGAVDALRHLVDAVPCAQIEPEEFFDFQAVRPHVRLTPSGQRAIDWPSNLLSFGERPERDLLLLAGTEPNLRWRAFTEAILDYARELEVQLVVCVGALQVDTPHTRPVPLTIGSSDPDIAERLGARPGRYEGPTGITGVLTQSALDTGFATVSMWAGVPHYLAAANYAAGAAALTNAICRALDLDLDLEPLRQAADEQASEIADLVAQDEELAAYVAELESRADQADSEGLSEQDAAGISGEELAVAFEQYLRDRDDES